MRRFFFNAEAAAVPLRDYQEQSVDALIREINAPSRITNKFVIAIAAQAAE